MTTVTVTLSVALPDGAPDIAATRWERIALEAATATERFVRERAVRRMAAVAARAARESLLAETRDSGARAAAATGMGMTRGC